MSDSEFDERFASVARVYGYDGLFCLKQSRVSIIGIGGVGSWVAEALVRTGVSNLLLIDGDVIARSNVNRQIHTLESSIGKAKAEVMRSRLLEINPECQCEVLIENIDDENLNSILGKESGHKFDIVIDAIDRIKHKSAIIAFCKKQKLPVLTIGGAGGLLDPTKIEVSDLTKTWNDPLSAGVRSRLRYKYNFSSNLKRSFGVPCVYSTEQRRYPDKNGSIGFSKPGVKGLSLDCNYGYGSSVAVTASFGLIAAEKAMQILLKKCK